MLLLIKQRFIKNIILWRAKIIVLLDIIRIAYFALNTDLIKRKIFTCNLTYLRISLSDLTSLIKEVITGEIFSIKYVLEFNL